MLNLVDSGIMLGLTIDVVDVVFFVVEFHDAFTTNENIRLFRNHFYGHIHGGDVADHARDGIVLAGGIRRVLA